MCEADKATKDSASWQAGNPSWHWFIVPHHVVRSTKALYIFGPFMFLAFGNKLAGCPC